MTLDSLTEGPSFDWLRQISSVSRSLQQAHNYIVGGPLTETLIKVGDVHLTSAVEHLKQAERNPAPRERLLLALASMQDAYFFYEASLKRGIGSLRRTLDLPRLLRTREKAVGCSASVALIGWTLDEAARSRREWLDRAAEQLKNCIRDYAGSRHPYRDELFGGEGSRWRIVDSWDDFYNLANNILPPELAIRPGWALRPTREVADELRARGYKVQETLQDFTAILGGERWPESHMTPLWPDERS